MSNLIPVLEAVDRLNSWVRSESFKRGTHWSGVRRHVYQIKRMAIARAQREFVCLHRPHSTLVTCRSCGGSGKYTDWDGRAWPNCRACGSKGIVKLDFVQTQILVPQPYGQTFTWNSPRDKWGLPADRLGEELTGIVMQVDEPGTDMSIDDAARDLLLCDATFPRQYGWCSEFCDCEKHYALYLGRADGRCAHCGDAAPEDQATNCGKTIGRVNFSFAVCKPCYLAKRSTSAALFDVGIPEELLRGEHVRRWVELNGAVACEKDGCAV